MSLASYVHAIDTVVAKGFAREPSRYVRSALAPRARMPTVSASPIDALTEHDAVHVKLTTRVPHSPIPTYVVATCRSSRCVRARAARSGQAHALHWASARAAGKLERCDAGG